MKVKDVEVGAEYAYHHRNSRLAHKVGRLEGDATEAPLRDGRTSRSHRRPKTHVPVVLLADGEKKDKKIHISGVGYVEPGASMVVPARDLEPWSEYDARMELRRAELDENRRQWMESNEEAAGEETCALARLLVEVLEPEPGVDGTTDGFYVQIVRGESIFTIEDLAKAVVEADGSLELAAKCREMLEVTGTS